MLQPASGPEPASAPEPASGPASQKAPSHPRMPGLTGPGSSVGEGAYAAAACSRCPLQAAGSFACFPCPGSAGSSSTPPAAPPRRQGGGAQAAAAVCCGRNRLIAHTASSGHVIWSSVSVTCYAVSASTQAEVRAPGTATAAGGCRTCGAGAPRSRTPTAASGSPAGPGTCPARPPARHYPARHYPARHYPTAITLPAITATLDPPERHRHGPLSSRRSSRPRTVSVRSLPSHDKRSQRGEAGPGP